MTEVEKLLKEIRELKKQTAILDSQIYTLKASLETMFAMNEEYGLPTDIGGLSTVLAVWAKFEVPDLPE